MRRNKGGKEERILAVWSGKVRHGKAGFKPNLKDLLLLSPIKC